MIRSKDRDGQPLRSVICRRCGLVWTDPRLPPDEVRAFYAHEYRLAYKGAYEPRPRQQYRNARTASDRIARLGTVIRPGLRILDVGAGSGEVVYLLRALGCAATGIEPNEAYANYAAATLGLPVACGFYQDAAVDPGSLDVVTMFHTVEHLEDPATVIRKAADWLTPGGTLAIEVPNVEAVCQQPHQQFHRGHLYHFNLTTLAALLVQAGFVVADTYTSPDGGNIAVTGRWSGQAPPAAGFEAPANYAHVAGVLRRHTIWRHVRSVHPWVRPLRKLASRIEEWRQVSRYASSKAMLDAVAGGMRPAAGAGRRA